jgi:uncharacterized protein (DUF779 family)
MSQNTLEAVDDLLASSRYYENKEAGIIDNPSGLEMAAFLEHIIGKRPIMMDLLSDRNGDFYITLHQKSKAFIIIDCVSGKWGMFKHQEQFLLRARVCEVGQPDYEFLHQENSRSYDQKLVYIEDKGRTFIEARRFINMAGGTTIENFSSTLNSFIESSRLLSVALQMNLDSAKRKEEVHVPLRANTPRH